MSRNRNGENRRKVEMHTIDFTLIKAVQVAMVQAGICEGENRDYLLPSSVDIDHVWDESGNATAKMRYNGYPITVEYIRRPMVEIKSVLIEDDFTRNITNPHEVGFDQLEGWDSLYVVTSTPIQREILFLAHQALAAALGTKEAFFVFTKLSELPRIGRVKPAGEGEEMCMVFLDLEDDPDYYSGVSGVAVEFLFYEMGYCPLNVRLFTKEGTRIFKVQEDLALVEEK